MSIRLRASILALLCALALPLAASAQGVTVEVDGRILSFDQPPMMMGGRVLVPLRGIFESLGATVGFSAPTRTITATRGSTQVTLTLGNPQAQVNGQTVMLDTPAQSVGGRTLVPLRFVSEALGADVKWIGGTQTVLISSSAAPPVTNAAPPTQPPPMAPPVQTTARPAIETVIHNGAGGLHPGDTLQVLMTGTPGGAATFDIMGLENGIGMQETSAGRYQGSVSVTPDMQVRRGTLVVHLVVNGLETVQQASRLLTLGTPYPPSAPAYQPPPPRPQPYQPVFVNVTSPRASDRVPGDFTVVGTTTPFATVTVQAEMRRALIPGVLDVNAGRVETASAPADAAGNYQIPIHTGVRHMYDVTLRVTAQDTAGNASGVVQFNIAAGP